MLIKKDTEYAVLGLMLLAEKKHQFQDARIVAQNHGISESLLPKIFRKLACADILESKLGPGGGFRLLKDPKEISLFEIIRAVQAPNVIKCYEGKAPYCQKPICALRETVRKMEHYLENYLSNTTLNELINNY